MTITDILLDCVRNYIVFKVTIRILRNGEYFMKLKSNQYTYFIKDIIGFFLLWIGGKSKLFISNSNMALTINIFCIILALSMFIWGLKDIGKNVENKNTDEYKTRILMIKLALFVGMCITAIILYFALS